MATVMIEAHKPDIIADWASVADRELPTGFRPRWKWRVSPKKISPAAGPEPPDALTRSLGLPSSQGRNLKSSRHDRRRKPRSRFHRPDHRRQ